MRYNDRGGSGGGGVCCSVEALCHHAWHHDGGQEDSDKHTNMKVEKFVALEVRLNISS